MDDQAQLLAGIILFSGILFALHPDNNLEASTAFEDPEFKKTQYFHKYNLQSANEVF